MRLRSSYIVVRCDHAIRVNSIGIAKTCPNRVDFMLLLCIIGHDDPNENPERRWSC